MPIAPQSIADMALSVIDDHYKFKKVQDWASLFPDSFVAGKFLSTAKTKGGSHTTTFRAKVRNVGEPRFDVGLFDEDQVARNDFLVEGRVRYTGINTGTHFDETEEEFQNPSAAVKLDYIKSLLEATWQRLNLEFSCRLFAYPAASTDSGILGIPYWISRSSSTSVQAFSHDNAIAVYSDDVVGNINQSTNSGWKNGTAVVDTLASPDGLDTLSEAMDKCNFRTSGLSLGSPDGRELPNYTMFYDYESNQEMERYMRTQNDNIGDDAGRFRGSQKFRGVPLVWLWELSYEHYEQDRINPAYAINNPYRPLFGINWSNVNCLTKLGSDFKRTVKKAPNQRFVTQVFWDQWLQMCCVNRRDSFCITRAA